MPIKLKLRAVLLLKALLLLAFAAVFGFIAVEAVRGDHAWWARALALLTVFPAPFLVMAASRGVFDAVQGHAVQIDGAVALDAKGRRIGYSVKLPDGRFAEFPLFNPYPALTPGKSYAVVVGRWSNVIVEPPRAL
jgi:hypothetical protein